MNFNYFEYMLKERVKVELERSERQRLLKDVVPAEANVINEVPNWFVRFVNHFRRKWLWRYKQHSQVALTHMSFETAEEEQ